MLPPRALLFPHESLHWSHLTTLWNELIELTLPKDLAGPLAQLRPELWLPSQLLLCVEATTLVQVAAWADVVQAHALPCHILLPLELTAQLPPLHHLSGLGLTPVLTAPGDRPLIELDARARQRVLRSLSEVTRARAMPALAPASNAYGVALDDLLVEQCANLANVRHFFLPELHPPRALLGIRDRPVELVRMHRVQEDDDADFLRAWVDGGAITTARAAAKKIAGDLFTQFARRRRDN